MGAISYLPKPFHMDALKEKVNAVIESWTKLRYALINQAYISLQQPTQIKTHPISKEITKQQFENVVKVYGLTKRELEISQLIATGKSIKKIADQLNVSESTIKSHATNIYNKMNVKNRYELTDLLKRSA